MLTRTFKAIDLDSMPLPYMERKIQENKRPFRGQRPEDRLLRTRQWKSLGIRPERLLDWRGLERRWSQLDDIVNQASEAVWDIYRKLSRISTEKGGGGEVWIPLPGGESCDVFRVDKHDKRQSLGTESFKRLLERAVPDPSLRPYVVLGDDLDRLVSYKRRVETMRRRAGAYWVAFRQSMEARLEAYATSEDNLAPIPGYNFHNPCAFVFSNDDRTYLITSNESGTLTWHDRVTVCLDGFRPA